MTTESNKEARRIGLKTETIWHLNRICADKIFMFFGVRCFNVLNVQFLFKCTYSKVSFNNFMELNNAGFSKSFQKLCSCSAIIFVGLVESPKTSESEPFTFCVINIPKSHRQPCRDHSTLKYDQSFHFASCTFGAPWSGIQASFVIRVPPVTFSDRR